MKQITSKLKLDFIDIVDYVDMPNIKDSPKLRNVIFHIVRDYKDIPELETELFDVFILIN